MKWQYLPRDRNGRLAWLECELAEGSQAIGRIHRFGANSCDPSKEMDPVKNPNNIGQLLLEMWDIEMAMRSLYADVAQFLGEDQVKALREYWQSLAFPPEQPVDASQSTQMGPTVACMACEGKGYVVESVTEKLKSKSICGICEGSGRVAATEGQT